MDQMQPNRVRKKKMTSENPKAFTVKGLQEGVLNLQMSLNVKICVFAFCYEMSLKHHRGETNFTTALINV